MKSQSEVTMEERYKRLQYDPSRTPQFWPPTSPKAIALGRFQRHLPAIPKKKIKDSIKKTAHFEIPVYPKHYKDKYGSVSAHSTSAIYGALRAPHYAMYGPTDMWYSSVRSLNRDVLYTAEAYEWRETQSSKEVLTVSPQVEVIPRPACMCMIRRRHLHDGSIAKSCRLPSCQTCSPTASNNGTTNGVLLSKRVSGIPERNKSLPIKEAKVNSKSESTSRMSGYRECITGSKFNCPTYKRISTKQSRRMSRKSILECDVTAYDLIQKVPKTPSVQEIDDSDIDDNLSDNAVGKINKATIVNYEDIFETVCTSHAPDKKHTSEFQKAQSEKCIYRESYSVLIGGQRIFTDNENRSKSPNLCGNLNSGSELEYVNSETDSSKWRKLSVSEESVCIPDPDYDFSDDSDNSTVINSYFTDPKFTYSPPPIRKSMHEHRLGYIPSKLSKSMSSLQSDDTFEPSVNRDKANSCNWISELQECDIFEIGIRNDLSGVEEFDEHSPLPSNAFNLKLDSKFESSSDCSSSRGTLSDYPTWTSSSSSELKSILKSKKKREDAIKELEDASRALKYLQECKDSHKKKQVQFRPGSSDTGTKLQSKAKHNDNVDESMQKGKTENSTSENLNTVTNDTNEALTEATDDKRYCKETELNEENCVSQKGASVSLNNPFSIDLSGDFLVSSIKCGSKAVGGRCSSYEDIRGSQAKRRSTLPKRRFSDLHVFPSLDGNDSPDRSSSCLDLLERDKVLSARSVFCVSLDGNVPKTDFSSLTIDSQEPGESRLANAISPSSNGTNNQTVREEDQDVSDEVGAISETYEDNLKNNYENIDPIYEELSEISNSSKRLLSCECEPKSFFEGASKTDILSYLADAKERGLSAEDLSEYEKEEEEEEQNVLNEEATNRVITNNIINHQKVLLEIEEDMEKEDNAELENSEAGVSKNFRISEVERNDSGVGTETTNLPRMKFLPADWEEQLCADCDHQVEPQEDEDSGLLFSPLVCRTCEFRRSERKEIIIEFVDTELKYGRDLRIIKEHIKCTANEFRRSERKEIIIEFVDTELKYGRDLRIIKEHIKCTANEFRRSERKEIIIEFVDTELKYGRDLRIIKEHIKCTANEFRRSERKEIIIEFVDTELKYGRDLRIMKEEFYRPMEIAGLLLKEQLFSIFLNLDELTAVNTKFSEKLQDALDIAMEHGDEDYTTVNIGKIFLETSSMLHVFETYCVKQASASILLSNLEKEKELLCIFLRVSQMENTLLRRMNLPAFLMVPVQRVTRYPLLLRRLHKVTPIHHKDRNALKESQQKVELHLQHINQQTKGVGGTKIWRRISNISVSHRRLGKDIGSIKLRKMTLEVLNWKQDEARFVIAGRLLLTQITDYPWNKKGKTVKFTPLHALLIALGKPNSNYRPESLILDNVILFSRNTGIRDASLVLMKEKNGRFNVVRDPLYLGNCVVSCETESDDVFEIQEYTTKEAYILKGETKKDTKEWFRQLRYHAKDLGKWRKRRNALANIMINGMIRQ